MTGDPGMSLILYTRSAWYGPFWMPVVCMALAAALTCGEREGVFKAAACAVVAMPASTMAIVLITVFLCTCFSGLRLGYVDVCNK